MHDVAVVGLGKAGLPLASVIADCGLNVVGVDVDEERCAMINEGINPIPEERGLDELIARYGGKRLIATSRYEDAKDCRAYIVIVPVLVDEDHRPDLSILESAIRSVGRLLELGDLVVVESTLPPMTTETKVRWWLEEESGLNLGEFFLAYSPERIMTGYSISRLREFPKVIGGVDERSGNIAYELYRKFIPNIKRVSNSRTAEFIKVMEGCYRDVNIALANELFKIAEMLDIDFEEAKKFANHTFCHIHDPSTGVGGHCIPVYPWFLIKIGERIGCDVRLIRMAREINDDMVNYWAERIILACMKVKKPLKDVKICIKGVTFRRGVREIYHSRNLALAKLLKSKGLNVYVYDDLMDRKTLEELGLDWIEPKNADVVFNCFDLRIEMGDVNGR